MRRLSRSGGRCGKVLLCSIHPTQSRTSFCTEAHLWSCGGEAGGPNKQDKSMAEHGWTLQNIKQARQGNTSQLIQFTRFLLDCHLNLKLHLAISKNLHYVIFDQADRFPKQGNTVLLCGFWWHLFSLWFGIWHELKCKRMALTTRKRPSKAHEQVTQVIWVANNAPQSWHYETLSSGSGDGL